MDAHFAVSLQIQHLRCTCARRMLASDQKWQEGSGVALTTGPLSTWFYHALSDEGVPAICIEARHAQKILNETLNKTDANDADGLAQLAEAGFYKVVRVKSFDAMLTHSFSVCGAQPIFDEIDTIAAQRLSCCPVPSFTIRTARSRTSGEYLFVVFVMMLHPTHELEPPANPARFRMLPELGLDAIMS